jgi:hypothetical protein
MVCMVCEREIPAGDEQYANAWEKTRKRYPCCSDACCARFDPDIHWVPGVRPEPADDGEQARLMAVARTRLGGGDSPSVIVREMLLAGVAPSALRKLLAGAYITSSEQADERKRMDLIGGLIGLVTGRGLFFKNRDKRDPKLMKVAMADLDQWER